ncbi:SMC family ATPase [Bacillus timonensis]|nr:SMC family ATPase [Bacillus timonensis]
MKPILLEVAGLHSFREKQTIDFDSLCAGGVFGIFGPTGSGKSSILDAMTLALYGKVERATNNTQGIMNHAEDELSVSFTFELENANGKRRYTIDRTFKRTDELRVRSATSRLIEKDIETVVLADKTNEVNQHIQDLLGLTIDDFTRAVVLPQGKFAEFLSLKGADRRQMLQRLFNLEQYGDSLNKRLKDRLTEAKSQLSEILAEQAGLGDASDAAVKAAEERVKESEVLLNKRTAELEQVEVDFEKKKQLWAWLQEKSVHEEKLAVVSKETAVIKSIEEKLSHAEQAERMKPYLDEYEAATKAVNTWRQRHEALRQHLNEMKNNFETVNKKYHEVRVEKAENLPKLISKKQQLEDALEVQQKVKELELELNDLNVRFEKQTVNCSEKQTEIEKMKDILTRSIDKQKMLKLERAENLVTAAEREKMRLALEMKQEIIGEEKMMADLEATRQKKLKAYKDIENTLTKKSKEEEQVTNDIEELFHQTQFIYKQLCDREIELEKMICKIERQLTQEKEAYDQERMNSLAFQLANELVEGKACPVCGSHDHPNPVKVHGGNHEELLASISSRESAIVTGSELKQKLSTLKIQLEQVSHSFVQENTLPVMKTKDLPEVKPFIVDGLEAADCIHAITVEGKSLQQDFLKIKQSVEVALKKLHVIKQDKQQLQVTLDYSKKDLKELEEKLAECSRSIEAVYDQWKKNFHELTLEEADFKVKEIKRKDEEIYVLEQRIEKSVAFIEETERKLNELKDHYIVSDRELAEIRSSVQTKTESLTENKTRLSKVSGNENVETLLEDIKKRLIQLEEKEIEAYNHWTELQDALQKVESETHAALQSLTESKNRFEMASSKWTDLLLKTSFKTGQDVKDALLLEKEMVNLREKITSFWDKLKQINQELEKLNNLVSNQQLSEAEWDEIQKVRLEMKQSVNEAVEAKGAAVNARKVIVERHERYNELEEKRKKRETLVEQYNKLQSVFKGNSFVEYIAEEQLEKVSRDASERLGILTRQRYAIEVDSQGGFIMRDDANGGVRRPVTTLSGGETFLTSLALALSLSAQIQLRGEYPLQFFFLDEGFGTLDGDLLDTVITALEKLHSNQLAVGVISHVPELRARLPRRLIVHPSEPSGKGTSVELETL